jgi:hypothetical protein
MPSSKASKAPSKFGMSSLSLGSPQPQKQISTNT